MLLHIANSEFMIAKNKIQIKCQMSMLRLNKLMITKMSINAKNKINTMNKEINDC